jgi:hypothetical protein
LVDETKVATTQPQHPSPALLRQAELLQQLPKEHQRVMAWLIRALLNDRSTQRLQAQLTARFAGAVFGD